MSCVTLCLKGIYWKGVVPDATVVDALVSLWVRSSLGLRPAMSLPAHMQLFTAPGNIGQCSIS